MTASQDKPSKIAIKLYDGEEVLSLAGYPAMTKYIPGDGDPCKPLAAFIPGGAHNARISYGGHDGSHSEDFLAHWFHQQGYGFLGISYPLESNPEVMPPKGSAMNIRDWGRQGALAIKKTIEEHGLPLKVVVLAWSMGGKILEPITTEARALGVDVQLYVSLAATPALWGVQIPLAPSLATCTSAGNLDLSFAGGRFLSQLAEQNQSNDSRTIIDAATYKREYIGAGPAVLGGYGLRYEEDEKRLVEDKWAVLEQGRADNYAELPAMASIYPTSPSDWQHSMSDKINWSYLIVHKFIADAKKAKESNRAGSVCAKKGQSTWEEEKILLDRLRSFIYGIPDRMIAGIGGSHFFFVGARGARQTAEKVIRFVAESEVIGLEFERIVKGHQ